MKYQTEKEKVDIVVRRWGLGDALDGGPDIDEELRRANSLWNKLVEIDRTSAEAYAAALAEHPGEAEAAAALQVLYDERTQLAEERRKQRRDNRSRRVAPNVMTDLAALAPRIATAKEALKAVRAEAKTAQRERLTALEGDRRAAVGRARRDSGVYWGTANAVVQYYESARSAVLRKRAQGQPAELHFRRYVPGGGRIRNQVMGGISTAEFAAGRGSLRLDAANERLTLTAYSRNEAEPRELTRMRRGRPLSSSDVLAAVGTSSAVRVKFEPGPLPWLVCTTSSSGFFNQSEESILRMNADTRVLDCATPSKRTCLSVCFTLVR